MPSSALAAVVVLAVVTGQAIAAATPVDSPATEPIPGTRITPPPAAKADLSGHARLGVASFYAKIFSGRIMADGRPMNPRGDNAASKTLPLGTTARVTNLDTGRSAEVTIRDRGPYVRGRIVDLSPATARSIGIDRQNGVARFTVAPIAVPLPNGAVRAGAAAGRPEPLRQRHGRSTNGIGDTRRATGPR